MAPSTRQRLLPRILVAAAAGDGDLEKLEAAPKAAVEVRRDGAALPPQRGMSCRSGAAATVTASRNARAGASSRSRRRIFRIDRGAAVLGGLTSGFQS